jgi:hypothetical protein
MTSLYCVPTFFEVFQQLINIIVDLICRTRDIIVRSACRGSCPSASPAPLRSIIAGVYSFFSCSAVQVDDLELDRRHNGLHYMSSRDFLEDLELLRPIWYDDGIREWG